MNACCKFHTFVIPITKPIILRYALNSCKSFGRISKKEREEQKMDPGE